MKKYILIVCLLFCGAIFSQSKNNHSPKVYQQLANKNYYLLAEIDKDPSIKKIFQEDKVLNKILSDRHKSIRKSLKISKNKVSAKHLVSPYLYSDKEISKISNRIEKLYKKSEALKSFIQDKIKTSGAYKVYEANGNDQMLINAWELCAKGINHTINTYGNGEPPQYKTIDSISYRVDSDYYKQTLYVWSDHLSSSSSSTEVFYSLPYNFALSLLYLNHRDEAVKYEPLAQLENKKAKDEIAKINFSDYKYASIVILGNGPENYRDRLSALGKLNIKLGAEKFLEGKAPLIIVSGGHAHPYRAEFAEAIEMKKELINQYNIPESRIIIEPYARHTTTNLRNASRLLIEYKTPLDKLSLVVTNNFHSDYTGSKMFSKRCKEELGYLPAIIQERLDKTTLEFLPQIESLQQNPLEPLDP